MIEALLEDSFPDELFVMYVPDIFVCLERSWKSE